MPKFRKKLVLVNRGPAGLLNKKSSRNLITGSLSENGEAEFDFDAWPKDRIAVDLLGLARPTSSLVLDPMNARLHPERNIEAIKRSLCLYGQVKPLVVRKATMVVVAGNGTLEAARSLGWTNIAAMLVEMDEVEAAGYGLADNRTAELAKWDWVAVKKLDLLLSERGHLSPGWSTDELAAMRASPDFVEPPEDFPEVDETIAIESVCPKCGYAFSGGQKKVKKTDA